MDFKEGEEMREETEEEPQAPEEEAPAVVDLWLEQLVILNSIRSESVAVDRSRMEEAPAMQATEKYDSKPPVAVLDDDEVKRRMEAEEPKKQGKEIVEAGGPEEVDENAEALKEAPFWLPDGWIINVRHGDDGSTYRYYTSPVSDYTFSTDMEALDYLFSEMDERILESEACAEDNELHFYVHRPTGMRFFSKEDVLRYVNEGKISGCDVKGLCDTISEDNILAQVEFNPDGLPKGWVKELVFRKCNDGIRKDPYYTDPVSHLLFRTLKSAISYLQTGEISKHAYLPRRSVTDIYSFDGCADLLDTPDNGESKASSRARSRAISSSVKYTAEVGGIMARGEKRPPPPVEAAKYGGVACPVSSAKTGGEDEAVCRQAPSAKERRVDEEQPMES
ncbi:hypothetical protein D1007_49728 [Hordeum vulgare]|nr:hypothetical protein D1007_49728 [Hordeum vulgare]